MKRIITLTQDDLSGATYTVVSLVGSAQLLIGQTIDRDRVLKWTTEPQYSNVVVRITGLTDLDAIEEDQQTDLLEPSKKQNKKNTLAMAK